MRFVPTLVIIMAQTSLIYWTNLQPLELAYIHHG